MRIGGSVEKAYSNPEEWYELVKELGYSAVLPPFGKDTPQSDKREYLECIKKHDLIIGEVGIWRNTLSVNDDERKSASEYAKSQLAFADEIGANCCVNIVGSRGIIWDGFHEDNYSADTYTLIVDSIREIIDAVKPKNTFYTIEPMPWMVPDSPDEYLQLIKDVNRDSFGVHLDFVNMINCPKRYVLCSKFIEECFQKLGPFIKSIHGKDVFMEQKYTTVIHEVMPGKGIIDYKKVALLCEKLGKDTVLFVEHLPDFESYKQAAAYVRRQAELAGVTLI